MMASTPRKTATGSQPDTTDETPVEGEVVVAPPAHCPTPDVCFPYGWGEAYAGCVHGETLDVRAAG